MTDKPSVEPSGDAEFQRWFAEQDPFGTSKAAQQIQREKVAKDKPSTPLLLRFGPLFPFLIAILGIVLILGIAFFIGTRI
jgi:hypothetical protein